MSFQIDIQNEGTLKVEVLQVPGTLQVIELYQSWCGPSKAAQGTLKRIYFDLTDRPLKFFTANVDKIPIFKEYLGKCQPVFLFYKDGQQVGKVLGVQAPTLQKDILQLSDPNAAAAAS